MQTGQGHFVLKLSQIFQLLKKVIALNIWIKTEKKNNRNNRGVFCLLKLFLNS